MTNYNVVDWMGFWNTKKTLNKNLKKIKQSVAFN